MLSLTEWLASNPVFAPLKESDRERLAQIAIRKKFTEGEWIALYGEAWPYLFLVTSGSIHALKESSEGRSLIAATLEPGELFWGLAFFEENTPMPVSFQAQHDSQICLWSREQIRPWLWENGRFSWELSRLMVRRMQQASTIVEEFAFQTVAGRLAGLLLSQYPNATEKPVARNLTLDQMAAHIGTTREVVCRLLYRFSDEDLIHITRTEFVINNKLGLRRLGTPHDNSE
jgi:CRP/FNR family transcriptional regulator, cyclic AMP receptor protein